MKPQRTRRLTRPRWPGKGLSAGDRAMLSEAKPTCANAPAQVKPFAGKVFYLDLPSNRTADMLERDIGHLGGIVEKFFSKEIEYLVSNKREARYVHCIKQDSPVVVPDSGPSSPQPRSNHDDSKSKSQVQTDTSVPSRGKSLVEKVVKEQERVKMNKILSNALEWGVKILYVDDVITYVKKKKKIFSSQCPATNAVKTSVKAESAEQQGFKKSKGGRIRKPFVKVEDSSRHYRPIYLTMPNIPEFNLRTLPPHSPFCVEDKAPPGNKQSARRGAKVSASEELPNGRKKNKKRGGYCECCMIKYENVTTHVKSDRHKAFSRSDEYLVLDKLVSTLHFDFLIKTKVKRPKCSVSSVLIAPGPSGKPQKTENVTGEDGHEGSYSAHTLNITSVTDSSLTSTEGRTCRNLEKSKRRSVTRKRLCRQNVLTSCSQKAEQAQVPEPRMEAAPRREGLASVPPEGNPVNEVTQATTQQAEKGSTSCLGTTNIGKEASLKGLTVVASQRDKEDDSSAFQAVQDKTREEESLPSLSFSPARKIQRRVRVHRRKTRQVDTCDECVRPTEVPDSCVLKLWELFQSSDDMDGEFMGFEH
ncbi:protein DBF4 homolog A isoform 2-T3 [Spinachia spinachia]